MSMRIALAAFAVVAGLAAVAHAAPKWTGAGWYVFADTDVGYILEKGPYASKDACTADMPKDDEDAIYDCMYLATRPTWDD